MITPTAWWRRPLFFPLPDPTKPEALPDLAQQKQAFRDTARQRRAEAARAAGADAAGRLAAHLTAIIEALPAGVVSAYLPIADEIDPGAALDHAAGLGWTRALPVVMARAEPLRFRAWQPGDALEDGPLRTRHPAAGAAEVRPDLLLVPMLAFDASGQRMGWGGGFYDRTLAALRAEKQILAIGIGFAGQQVDKVPSGPHDAPLDAVATDAGVTRFKEF